MILSSLFHTFLCHSETVKYKWQEADHSGILIALWGTYTRLVALWGTYTRLVALWGTYTRLVALWGTYSILVALWGTYTRLVALWDTYARLVDILSAYTIRTIEFHLQYLKVTTLIICRKERRRLNKWLNFLLIISWSSWMSKQGKRGERIVLDYFYTRAESTVSP